jgi:hypothetical protein
LLAKVCTQNIFPIGLLQFKISSLIWHWIQHELYSWLLLLCLFLKAHVKSNCNWLFLNL